jgi:hypothetical protein
MTGTHLFDRLADGSRLALQDPGEAEELRELGEGMVAAAIASGKMLREHRARMFPGDDSPAAMAVAKTLQSEFQQWAQEADAVYERALTLHRAGHAIVNLAELNDLIGLTQAMLQISPEDHVRSLKQVANGKLLSMEELRRELHLPPKR